MLHLSRGTHVLFFGSIQERSKRYLPRPLLSLSLLSPLSRSELHKIIQQIQLQYCSKHNSFPVTYALFPDPLLLWLGYFAIKVHALASLARCRAALSLPTVRVNCYRGSEAWDCTHTIINLFAQSYAFLAHLFSSLTIKSSCI